MGSGNRSIGRSRVGQKKLAVVMEERQVEISSSSRARQHATLCICQTYLLWLVTNLGLGGLENYLGEMYEINFMGKLIGNGFWWNEKKK